MATINTAQSGPWSAPSTWVGGSLPANNDTVNILTGHTVTYDIDNSAMANGYAVVDINGSLVASTNPGTYVLKCVRINTHVTNSLVVGSAVTPYPSTCQFTIQLTSTNHRVNVDSVVGAVKLYCTVPTYRFVRLTAPASIGATVLSVDTDVRNDWPVGWNVLPSRNDRTSTAMTENVIQAVSANTITLTTPLAAALDTGAYIILTQRNIRVIGSGTIANQFGFVLVGTVVESVFRCEIRNVYTAFQSGTGGSPYTFDDMLVVGCVYYISSLGTLDSTANYVNRAVIALFPSAFVFNTVYMLVADDCIFVTCNYVLIACYAPEIRNSKFLTSSVGLQQRGAYIKNCLFYGCSQAHRSGIMEIYYENCTFSRLGNAFTEGGVPATLKNCVFSPPPDESTTELSLSNWSSDILAEDCTFYYNGGIGLPLTGSSYVFNTFLASRVRARTKTNGVLNIYVTPAGRYVYTTSQKPFGFAHSYQMYTADKRILAPSYFDLDVYAAPQQPLRMRWWVYLTVAPSAILPTIQVVSENQIYGKTPLQEYVFANTLNAWQYKDISYTPTQPGKFTVRFFHQHFADYASIGYMQYEFQPTYVPQPTDGVFTAALVEESLTGVVDD